MDSITVEAVGVSTATDRPPSDRLNRVEEAADRLSISRAHTYELIRTGELPSVKIGRSRRIRESDLVTFIAQLTDQYYGD